jgi:hypothetical protein
MPGYLPCFPVASLTLTFSTRDNRDTRDTAPVLRFGVPALSRVPRYPGQIEADNIQCRPAIPPQPRAIRAVTRPRKGSEAPASQRPGEDPSPGPQVPHCNAPDPPQRARWPNCGRVICEEWSIIIPPTKDRAISECAGSESPVSQRPGKDPPPGPQVPRCIAPVPHPSARDGRVHSGD